MQIENVKSPQPGEHGPILSLSPFGYIVWGPTASTKEISEVRSLRNRHDDHIYAHRKDDAEIPARTEVSQVNVRTFPTSQSIIGVVEFMLDIMTSDIKFVNDQSEIDLHWQRCVALLGIFIESAYRLSLQCLGELISLGTNVELNQVQCKNDEIESFIHPEIKKKMSSLIVDIDKVHAVISHLMCYVREPACKPMLKMQLNAAALELQHAKSATDFESYGLEFYNSALLSESHLALSGRRETDGWPDQCAELGVKEFCSSHALSDISINAESRAEVREIEGNSRWLTHVGLTQALCNNRPTMSTERVEFGIIESCQSHPQLLIHPHSPTGMRRMLKKIEKRSEDEKEKLVCQVETKTMKAANAQVIIIHKTTMDQFERQSDVLQCEFTRNSRMLNARVLQNALSWVLNRVKVDLRRGGGRWTIGEEAKINNRTKQIVHHQHRRQRRDEKVNDEETSGETKKFELEH
jgi:hypothetical protein